jgi:dTDP-4-dehydrorhamnose reductase
MRIAVVGARGQLGAAIVQECSAAHEVTPLGRAELDITDDAAVRATMARERPDAIVNCAAYNDVDGAEDRPVDALNVNAFGVRALAQAAEEVGATLVHYSTDFVFDGTASAPYTEEDRPNPRSVYAASKLLGEWFALDAPRGFVLRVESLFGRAAGGGRAKGSVEAIRSALESGGRARVFEDRTVSPTYVVDAARATRQVIESAGGVAGATPGLYHCVNSGRCTWLELARELARQLGLHEVDARLDPVRAADVPLRAARPLYCALSNEKLRSAGVAMPAWQDALARYASAFQT